MSESKYDYVRNQARDTAAGTNHHCHWPGCQKIVPPAMWGCKKHWFSLPLRLRTKIWDTYKVGQEITKTPSSDYLKAAEEVDKWIREQGAVG